MLDWDFVRTPVKRLAGDLVNRGMDALVRLGAIGPDSPRGRRFGKFGQGSVICFPATSLYGERWIWVGAGTRFGPYLSLSVGMVPGQVMIDDPVIRIGDRCVIGKGSGIVGHHSIEIGDDVWTGHHVYITDQNHEYRDLSLPIGVQVAAERPVRIGSGSWLGHGVIVLPGATIGSHVVVAAGSVVTGELPDNCVAAGAPARVVRVHDEVEGWVAAGEMGKRAAEGPIDPAAPSQLIAPEMVAGKSVAG
jgi:acetyltransferase-like isoleucine patch superfamily enzyme